jgi:hypothetical protein
MVLLITDQSQGLCTGNGLRLTEQADAVPSIGMISAHVYEAAIYVIRSYASSQCDDANTNVVRSPQDKSSMHPTR